MDKWTVIITACVVWIPIKDVTSSAINWDPACGVTKGCFPSCQTGCDFLVKWRDSPSTGIEFELLAAESNSETYLSVGFSEDYRMGDDGVVSCTIPGSTVTSSYNDGTDNEVVSPSDLGLSSFSVSQANGIISCNFTRAYETSQPLLKNLHQDFILMLVTGRVKTKHGIQELDKHELIPWSSDGPVDFNSNSVVKLYKLNSPLVKSHGILMMLAWLLFSTIGIMTARYGKDLFPNKTLLGTKIWFQIHRTSMVLTLICVVVAFILIFVHIDGYSQIVSVSSRSVATSHPVLGIIVTVLTFINPIMALFRPEPTHYLRWLFNWAHFGVGLISQLLAVLTLFFGTVLQRAMLPDSVLYILGVHMLLALIAVVVLETLQRKHRRESQGETKRTKEANTAMLPVYVLSVHLVAVLAIAVAILAIIAAS